MEEVLSMKDTIAAMQLEIQALTYENSCNTDSSSDDDNVDEINNHTSFGQLELFGESTYPGSQWTTIMFNNLTISHNMEYNQVNGAITFLIGGVYKVTISHRGGGGGTSSSDWTAIRVYGFSSGKVAGSSSGYSQELGGSSWDTGTASTTFLSNIEDISDSYFIQLGRQDTALTISAADTIVGYTPPAIVCVIQYIGDQ